MIYVRINDTDRTADVKNGSISIESQLQQRVDEAEFVIFQGTKPSENQDVKIFKGDTIASFSGTTVTLNGNFTKDKGLFYVGQKLKIRIGDSDEEEVEVDTYDEDALEIELVNAPSGTVNAGDKIGEIIYGGIVSRVIDKNIDVLENLEYEIECVDYSKIFDKKLISDTWENRDSRYIINDFCNTTINYNHLIDQMDYATDVAIQAEWVEGGAGSQAITDTTNPYEADHWGVFENTTGASSYWIASPTSSNVSDFTGVNSGAPTKGKAVFWIEIDNLSAASYLRLYLGSSSGNRIYSGATDILDQISANDTPTYIELDLADFPFITGTPDWTAFDYAAFNCGGTSGFTFKISGLRFVQDDFFRHYPYVETTPEFDDLRSPQLKPTGLMQLLSKSWEYMWYIDYNRNIHFADIENEAAPISLTNTSNNFINLSTEIDDSQLGNRIIVRGGSKNSDNQYAQVFQGDSHRREWLLKNQFAFTDFVLTLDDGTDSNSAEAGTTTTNIKITGHGLSTGDHITNRTRGEVREITYVDVDNFTVEAVPSQTTGDNITFYSTSATLGIDGLDVEADFDYFGDQEEKSIRSAAQTDTLTDTTYIRMQYYEKVPIQTQYQDSGSVSRLKALNLGDGIFDLDPYTDRNITDLGTALAIAEAQVSQYSNAIIKAYFETDFAGLRAGMNISITDTNRSLDDSFLIQKVLGRQVNSRYGDYFNYRVTCGTTLYGIIEFFQKLLSTQDDLELNSDEIVETYVTSDETVESSDVNTAEKEGDENAKNTETVESSDVNQAVDWDADDWKFEPSVGQTLESRFDLSSFG